MPSSSRFTGIDGEPTPGIGKAIIPLVIPALAGSTFTADMIGGSGSYCPGLVPVPSRLSGIEFDQKGCFMLLRKKKGA